MSKYSKQRKKSQQILIDSYEDSVKKIKEINELFSLALEENNKQVVDDLIIGAENLKKKVIQI